MKLTGPACTEAMNEAEETRSRERAGGNAGGVRVERRVRQNGLAFSFFRFAWIFVGNQFLGFTHFLGNCIKC